MADWVRQNSSRVAVEVVLADGERLRGIVLVPRDKSLRDLLNADEPFMEFDCAVAGPTVLSKQSIRSIRQFVLPPAGQLAAHAAWLEQVGAWRALGLREDADLGQVDAAWRRLSALYAPENYPRDRVPSEIADFAASVTRRLELAYRELKAALERRAREAPADADAAA